MLFRSGKTVKLADYFGSKPIVLSLVYYDCPQLCTQVLTGLLGTLKTLPMSPGKDFIALTVSFDPKFDRAETLRAHATTFKANPAVWRFATAEEAVVDRFAATFGVNVIRDQQPASVRRERRSWRGCRRSERSRLRLALAGYGWPGLTGPLPALFR